MVKKRGANLKRRVERKKTTKMQVLKESKKIRMGTRVCQFLPFLEQKKNENQVEKFPMKSMENVKKQIFILVTYAQSA
jgi:hypothetical protein